MVRHIFAIFLGGATFFCHLFLVVRHFLSSLILYGDFLPSFLRRRHFLPFSGISYIRGEENFGLEFAKILSEKLNQVRVKMGKFKQKIDAQQIIEF